MTVEAFKRVCIDTKGVERFSFLSAADVAKITGRAAGTILNDMYKRKIEPISRRCRKPKFDGMEVYAYLVRIKQIELPPT